MSKQKKNKIIFWGTPDFAIPSLQLLIDRDYLISAVVTNPDEPAGRKKNLIMPPTKIFAQKYSIPILQPSSLKTYNLKLKTYNPDLFIVAAYGKIIPKKILNISKYGALNIHPSLLPRWRGPSPVQYTILNGDIQTGVVIMKIDEKMDHGPIVATSNKLQVTSKINYKELQDKLFLAGAKLLIDVLPRYLAGEIKPVSQDHSKATYSKILTKEDGKIDWSKSADGIERMVRAFDPWPGSWTIAKYRNRYWRIIIEEAEISKEKSSNPPGFLWEASKNLYVQTGKDILVIKRLKPEGRKSLNHKEFLQGYSSLLNQILN